MYLRYVHAGAQRVEDGEDAIRARFVQIRLHVPRVHLERGHRLHEALGERPAYRHDFPDGVHPGRQTRRRSGELLEGEARYLGDDVVERRLERRRRRPRDVVRDLIQRVPDRQLRRYLRDREPGGLARQRARPAHPRVHLDHVELVALRIHRKLDVRSSRLYPDLSYYADSGGTEGLVLPIGEGLGGGDSYGVAGVDAHGVDVLDGADDDYVVGEIAHDLELELLPAGDALLDECRVYRAGVEAVEDGATELAVVTGYGAALAAQGEAGADDEGEADPRGQLFGFGDVAYCAARGNLEPDALHRLPEEPAVLGLADGFGGGSEKLDAVIVEDAGLVQLDSEVQGGLATEGRKQSVGALAADDLCEGAGGEGLDVGGVGDFGVGHDGRGVRVHEDHAVTLVAQGAAGLGARVVELGGLSDHDRTRADDQDARDVVAARHLRGALHELVEEVAGVAGAGARFRMVLDAPGAQLSALDALDGAVVEVTVGQLYAVGQRLFAHGEAVVLARDLDPPRLQIPHRVVGTVVPEGHLVRLAVQGESEELVPEADAEDWNLAE